MADDQTDATTPARTAAWPNVLRVVVAIHTVDPDVIVFGGGMIAAGEPFLERIRFHFRDNAFAYPSERCELRYASLGSDAGFIGAAACARALGERTPV